MRNLVLTDQELIQRAKAGDNAAFGELWGRHEPQVLALCRRHLAGPHRDPAVDEQELAREQADRAAEIEARRARLQRSSRARKKRLELAELGHHSGAPFFSPRKGGIRIAGGALQRQEGEER